MGKETPMMIAIDQYNQIHKIPGVHPRKELLDRLNRKSAKKIYRDKKDGSTVCTGYLIAGLWLELFTPQDISA